MKIEWLLPTHESRTINEEIVKHNAKYHCFIDKKYGEEPGVQHSVKSLCGRHRQIVGYYEEIESGEIASRPDIACPMCRKKWMKEYQVLS